MGKLSHFFSHLKGGRDSTGQEKTPKSENTHSFVKTLRNKTKKDTPKQSTPKQNTPISQRTFRPAGRNANQAPVRDDTARNEPRLPQTQPKQPKDESPQGIKHENREALPAQKKAEVVSDGPSTYQGQADGHKQESLRQPGPGKVDEPVPAKRDSGIAGDLNEPVSVKHDSGIAGDDAAAIQDRLGKLNLGPQGQDGHSNVKTDTEVFKEYATPVTHTTITPEVRQINQPQITREIHDHDVHHHILPVKDTRYLPAKHYVEDPSHPSALIEIEPPSDGDEYVEAYMTPGTEPPSDYAWPAQQQPGPQSVPKRVISTKRKDSEETAQPLESITGPSSSAPVTGVAGSEEGPSFYLRETSATHPSTPNGNGSRPPLIRKPYADTSDHNATLKSLGLHKEADHKPAIAA